MATTEINVSNIGPIDKLTIPLPEDGGIVVLRGCQGSGKSTALRAIAATASGGKADVTLRDGATRGAVEWAGAKLSVTRSRTARTGELEIETIEGKYDISALVDPMIRDPERADAMRIKQLIAMTGAKADSSVYKKLIGEQRYASLELDDNTDDPIELFSRVVRSLQAKARSLEKKAEDTRVADVDVPERDGVPTVDDARKAVRDAETRLVSLQGRASERRLYEEKISVAKSQLQAMQDEYDGVSVEEASQLVDTWQSTVNRLTVQLDAAKDSLRAATEEMTAARQHYSSLEKFSAILNSAQPDDVTEAEVVDAERAVDVANDRLVEAVNLGQALAAAEKAKEANENASKWMAEAEVLRLKAADAEAVLATVLPSSDMRVVDGRIVVATDRSKNELYADLSHGERAILAIRTAAKHIPKGGVATISQEMWAAISPENRLALSQEAKQLGVVILTAEVTDSDLEVVVA